MMRTPGHAVNRGIVATTVLPLSARVVDSGALTMQTLDDTAHRITTWGGDAALYRRLLVTALEATVLLSPDTARSLGAVAGWRSGVLDLRADALTRLRALLDGGEPAAAAAALELDVADLAAFSAAQSQNPFAWPTTDAAIATVGGFAGLGGRWVAPPTQITPLGDAAFAVTCGDETWFVEADVFGARLSRRDERPGAAVPSAYATATVSLDSYLVTLERIA